jgi:hypothetical protein
VGNGAVVNQYGHLGLKGRQSWNGNENQVTVCLNELTRERLNYILQSENLGHLCRLLCDEKKTSIHAYISALINQQWFLHRKYEKEAKKRLKANERQKEWSQIRSEKLAEFKQFKKTRVNSVYLIKDISTNYTKIGITKCVESRLRALKSANPTVSLFYSHPAEHKAEKELHKIFKEQNVSGEWFNLTDAQIDSAKWILSNLCNSITGKFNPEGLYEWVLKNNPFKSEAIGGRANQLLVLQ